MTKEIPESDDAQSAAIQKEVDDFLAQGGKIQQVPAEEIRPRHFEMAPLIKMVTPRISPWGNDELGKAEALLYKMNISGSDPLAVRGTRTNKLTTYDVWAALVSCEVERLSDHPTWGLYDRKKVKLLVVELQIYKQTLLQDGSKDKKSHSILFAELLFLLLDRKKALKWIIKKPHILENMVLTAIEHVCDPRKFQDTRDYGKHRDSRTHNDHRARDDLSARQWAAKLGLANHKDWTGRWQARYYDFLNDLTYLDIFASEEVSRQL